MSTTDPMDAMLDYSGAAYDDLIKEADVDNRVGKHRAIVTKVTDDLWPSGDPRRKIQFSLLTAGNAKCDMTWSKPPSAEQIIAEKGTWEPGKKRAIALAVSIGRQLAKFYQTSPLRVAEGQEYYIETTKTRREKDGSGGFVRVIAFLDPNTAGQSSAPASGGPGF